MTINVLDYLERSVRIYPDKAAFIDIEDSVTYSNLHLMARRLGSAIARKTRGARREPIVVFVDRNIESLVAFLGVAYSGNFYVPIDMQMPKKRIQLILETLVPIGIVNTPQSIGFLEGIPLKVEEFDYTEITQKGDVDIKLLDAIRSKSVDLDPVYATFTSGSTGIPKGVITCHRSVIDMTDNLVETFKFDQDNIFGNQNPFYFDASIKDIYSSLSCGATMHILPKPYFMQLGKLVNYMVEKKIDTILWSAAAIALLANSKAFEEEKPHYLKYVMFSGEVMHNKVLNYWRRHLPDTHFVNLYGPTEITSVCTYYRIEKSYNDDEVLPIGIPFKNCEVLVLNDQNELVRGDETGELCVRGCCLAMGYYNNDEKTKQAFTQNPLNPHFPEVIYRTGDLAYWNDEGQIMFVSRKDNQVKHMGQRVELGEIEILMNSMDRVDASICFYDHDKQKIICIYQGKTADNKYIFQELRERVSKFMFPNILIELPELPYNLNGKIDRTLLKERYFKGDFS
jgi:D-alanine--poly(phosphoribitol) ligase subunit 1